MRCHCSRAGGFYGKVIVMDDMWGATLERAVKTAAQTATAVVFASGATSAFDVDWQIVLGTSLLAAILSVLTSMGSSLQGRHGPSLGDWERLDHWRGDTHDQGEDGGDDRADH